MGKDLTLGTIFKGKIDPTLKSSLKQLETIVKGLNTSLNNNVSALNKATTAQNKTTAATKKVASATQETTRAITFMGKQIGSIDGAYNRFMGALKVTVSYGIVATAIYSVINAMKTGVQAIIDYDQGLKNLQAITGATDFEVAAMGETIKQVARDTKFSTTEAADGMTLLGQAGLNAGESMTAMRDTALLATGTLSDMKTSTDLVSTTIRAFGMSATESGRIVDVFANAVNKSKLTIDKLRTAFNYVAATSSQAGLSIEETAATMMNLANNGLRASTIGTGFRQVLSKMVKPSSKLAETLASVGLKLDDINPSMVGWQGTLKSLSTILYDTDAKTVNMSKAFSLFGLRGAQAAAVVVKSFVSGDYQSALDKVYEIGTAEAMAGKQAEGLAVKLKNLIDRAGNVAVAFGEAGAANGIRVFLDVVRETLAALEGFVGSVAGQVVVQLAAVAGAFKLAMVAGKGLLAVMSQTGVVQAFTFSIKGLNAAIAGKSGLAGALTMAGMYVKTFLKSLGLIKIAVGLVVAGILAYRAALAKSMKDAEQAAVKNMQIVDSLEAYKGALVSTGEKAIKLKDDTDLSKSSNDAYLATLKRLIKAHPELTSKIEMSIAAYGRNNEAIANFTDAAHAEKVRTLVDLYNEYGKAGERAMIWAGFWKTMQAGFSAFVDVAAWGFDKLTGGVQIYIDLWALVITKVGEAAKHIPYFGEAASKMLLKTGKSLTGLKDKIITAYKEFGKGSEAAKEKAKKQKEIIDTLADAYVGVGKQGKMSFAEIQEALVKTKRLTADEVRDVLRAIEKKRLAMTAYSYDIVVQAKNATNKMTEVWQAYYNKQDVAGKVEVQQAWERLQKRYKDYIETLQKMVDANEISKVKMAQTALLWWDKELDGFKAKQAKEEDALTKSLEKRQAAHKRLADKVMSYEENILADLKRIRQGDMTDEQKYYDDRKEAREALARSIKAVAEAQTESEIKAAAEMLKDVSAKYRDLADEATDAFKKNSYESEKAKKEIVKGFGEITKTFKVLKSKMKDAVVVQVDTEQAEGAIEDLGETTKGTKVEIDGLTESVNKNATAADKTAHANKRLDDSMKGVADSANKAKKETSKWNDFLDTNIDITTNSGWAMKRLRGEVDAYGNTSKKATKETSFAEKAMSGYNESVKKASDSINNFRHNINSAKLDVDGLTDSIKRAFQSTHLFNLTFGEVSWYQKKGADTESHIGFNSGGKLPGYGGGDTVPAMLEKGEFVIRKEAVQEYGSGLFENLNGMVQKFALGGPVFTNPKTYSRWIGGAFGGSKQFRKADPEFLGDLRDFLQSLAEIGGKFGQGATAMMGDVASVVSGILQNAKGTLALGGNLPPSYASIASETILKLLDKKETAMMTGSFMQSITDSTANIVGTIESEASNRLTSSITGAFIGASTTLRAALSQIGQRENYGISQVLRKNSLGAWVTPLGGGTNYRNPHMATGGQLHGYGGGDTVPVMLEKGEFVIRKEAVQKYGSGLFENLNGMIQKMSIGGVAIPKMQTPKAIQPVQKFNSGGAVSKMSSPTINITISPTFMTGDRNSVKQVATLLRDEIKNIDHRYGVS